VLIQELWTSYALVYQMQQYGLGSTEKHLF
jgi:hypothetical protein